MQTVLQWGKRRALAAEEKILEIPFSHFLKRFFEWKELRADPDGNAARLKNFESLHGKGFVASLVLFERVLEERE
jgi:hypothetical protein